MSRQAIVGLFTVLGLIALFLVYFVLADLATRASGYEIGIHFPNAAGLTRGAIVYESGVQVGTVSQIKLLDDFSVDLIVAIKGNVDIPRDSQFVISAPLTGSSTVTIIPPRKSKEQVTLLPRYVLPLDQQPKGSNPVSVQDLLQAGQGELVKVDQLLTDLQNRTPRLLNELQSAISNANDLALTANGAVQRLAKTSDRLSAKFEATLDAASTNVVDLTEQLDLTLKRNGGRIDTLLVSLNSTASSLNEATNSLKSLATNGEVKQNLIDTTRQIARTTQNIADLTTDLRSMTGDPNTQAQLKNTVANINAAAQRATSLLGALGGTSSVYGVDAGATPAPAASGRIVPPSPAPVVPSPVPEQRKSGEIKLSPQLRNKIGELAKNLVEVRIRLSELSKQAANGTANPLLPNDRGPQSDFNVIVLPHADYQLMTGVNDLGSSQTWNFALRQRMAPGFIVGGGVLYSRLGVMGAVSNGIFGFEGYAYDTRHGYLDAYLRLRATRNIQLFAGERDFIHPERRTVYGLQYEFLGGK